MESPHERQQGLLLSRIINNVEKLNEAVGELNRNLQDINVQNMNIELVAQMFKNYHSNVQFHLEVPSYQLLEAAVRAYIKAKLVTRESCSCPQFIHVMAITKIVSHGGQPPQASPAPLRRVWDIQDRVAGQFKKPNNEGWMSSKGNPDISAIVIDNGTSAVKAGWSFDKSPQLSVAPILSKYKDRKWAKTYQFVGEDIYADQTAKSNMRQAFQGGGQIVSNWDVMEGVLDYIFIKLGIDSQEGGIDRPVVLTEPVANLAFSRNLMTELMFECYSARSLAYGIDSLFSYRYNGGKTGLAVSSSYSATHIIPIVDSKPLMSSTSRLNWGRAAGADFLVKLMNLKYPSFLGKWSRHSAEQILREHCYVSQDYAMEVSKYLDWSGLEDRDHVLQFPYTEHVVVEKTAEELEIAAAKRKESGRRLQEQAVKMRTEKLAQKESDYEVYKKIQAQSEVLSPEEFSSLLDSYDFDTEEEFDKAVKKLEDSLKRSRLRDLGEPEDAGPPEVPSFPLLEIADADLDPDTLKQKRQQRLAKNNYDARMRVKAEKEAEQKRLKEEARLDREKRENKFEVWAEDYRADRDRLVQKIKDKAHMKAEIGNRKSLASQMRMKTLANLAADSPKKRKRGGDDDDFGQDDADWSVYRDVAQGGTGASDDEDEEDLDAALKSVEAALLEYDPTFTVEDTVEGQSRSNWSRSLMHAFRKGPRPCDKESVREQHQVHLNVERIRVPEVIFQPPMAGVDQAGIVETIADISTLRLSDRAQGMAILKDVFLTGGNITFPGFDERLRKDLLAVLPAEAQLQLRRAKDPILDPWRGAAQWAGGSEWKQAAVTRQEYQEKGVDYLKEHSLGNAY